jgi:hypothetical protein
MIALSLRQPWAWVVLHLGKNLENRDWNTSTRGDFLIHASKGMSKQEYYDCIEFCTSVLGPTVLSRFPVMDALPRGGIVGAARLVDVIRPCKHCVYDGDHGVIVKSCGANHGWHMPWKYAFKLENIRPAPKFVPCRGMPGFFKVDSETSAALRA